MITSYAPSGYLSVAEAAEYSGFSIPSIRRRIAKGEINDTRMGRATRIHKDELDRWLAALPSTKAVSA